MGVGSLKLVLKLLGFISGDQQAIVLENEGKRRGGTTGICRFCPRPAFLSHSEIVTPFSSRRREKEFHV